MEINLKSLALIAVFVFGMRSPLCYAQPEKSILTLQSLLDEAEIKNPEIHAAKSKYLASRLRPSQESSLPDPLLGVMSTNMNNPVPFTSVGKDPQSNAGITFSQEIPFPGKLKLKGDIARKEANSMQQEYDVTRLSVLSRVKVAYYELSYLYTATDILARSKAALEKLARVAQGRYEVGNSTQQDVIKAQVQAAEFEARLIALEQKKLSSAAKINSLLGRPAETALERPEPIRKASLFISYEDLNTLALQNAPMLKARKELIDRNKLALDLSKKQYYPDMTLGGYYGNSGDLPEMWQLQVQFKVPLYFWEKQDYGVNESVHSLNEANAGRDAAIQAVNFSLKDEYDQARASEKLLELYSKKIIPDAMLAVESSLRSYESGKVDFLTILMNFVSSINYELSYEEQLMNFEQALARIEEIVGAPLLQINQH